MAPPPPPSIGCKPINAPRPPPPPPPLGPARSGAVLPPPPPAPKLPTAPSPPSRGVMPSPPPPPGVKSSSVPPPPLPSVGKGKVTSGPASHGRGRLNSGVSHAPKKASLKPLHWVKVTRAMQGSLWADSQKQENHSRYENLYIYTTSPL